jgi:parallel beta-helix repeat protein
VQHQQNGVMLYGCNKVTITENNASFNSGAGILMYESSENEVAHNIADYCCRIYSYRERDGKMSYHNGADAAAVVMMCNSSRNVVSHNMLRSGGDGVFLGGFHKDEIKTPCNENVFEHNDGSFSPNIAFEATFSERNVFRHNRADNCNFGFWLGYSSHTTVEDNSISGNRIAGVAIEHGHHNHIQKNKLVRNRTGMKFWVGANPVFTSFFPQHAESYATEIHQNELTRNELGIHIYTESGTSDVRCHSFHIQNNTLNDNRIAIQLERARQCDILNNLIKQNVEMGIKMVGCKDMNIHSNEM